MISIELQQYWEQTLQSPRYADPKRLLRFGAKAYSQHDEDGIIAEIFRRIGVAHSTFVEIGAGLGTENNSLALLLSGWRGLWVEANAKNVDNARSAWGPYIRNSQLRVERAFVTRENINAIVGGEGAGRREIDLLSIDIDGNDYWVWEAITSIEPRAVVIEYNATWFPPLAFTVAYDEGFHWDGSNYFGASLKALEMLGRRKGYNLVGCGFAGINAFFVRRDLCQDRFLEPFTAESHFEPPRYWMYRASGHPAGAGLIQNLAEPVPAPTPELTLTAKRATAPASHPEEWELIDSIIENPPDAMAIVDGNGLARFWPESARRLFGYTHAEMIGCPLAFLTPPQLRAGAGNGFETTVSAVRKDGDKLTVRIDRHDIHVQNEAEPYIALSFRLLSMSARPGGDAVKAECPDVNHARLADMVANLPAVLFTLDKDAVFTTVEGRGLEMVGAERGHLLGHSAFELYGDDTPTAADLRRAFQGEVSVGSARIRDAIFATALAPLRQEGDRVTGVIGVATNISAQMA